MSIQDEYPNNTIEQIEAIKKAYESTPLLLLILEKIKAYSKTKNYFSSYHGNLEIPSLPEK